MSREELVALIAVFVLLALAGATWALGVDAKRTDDSWRPSATCMANCGDRPARNTADGGCECGGVE